jgi:hypothetical protein
MLSGKYAYTMSERGNFRAAAFRDKLNPDSERQSKYHIQISGGKRTAASGVWWAHPRTGEITHANNASGTFKGGEDQLDNAIGELHANGHNTQKWYPDVFSRDGTRTVTPASTPGASRRASFSGAAPYEQQTRRARPGYYIASDGYEYPLSAMPQPFRR